jgi:DNA phosphorothioation-dependent restriction protein DptH
LPLHTASTLQDTISKAFNLGNKQRALLKELIMSAYSDAGIYRADEASWKNTAPTIADVCELYLNDENSSIDSLHAVLKELYDFEIFEPHGNKAVGLFDLLDGVTVIDLSGYNSELQNLVVAITLDLFYSQMQNQGHSKIDGNFRQINKIVLVDEADNFLSKNFESLRKILKEGREYGVGTILSTQFLNHFATSDNEYSNYILTWIIHRVNEIKEKEVGSLFDLPNKADRDDLIGVIKSLEKHYSIVNLAGSKPIKIKDKAFWELLSNQ